MAKLKKYIVGNMVFNVKNKSELYGKMAPWARKAIIEGRIKVTKIDDIKNKRVKFNAMVKDRNKY